MKRIAERFERAISSIEHAVVEVAEIPLPVKCFGEAHSNPIGHDNCMVCMPHWGQISTPVRVT